MIIYLLYEQYEFNIFSIGIHGAKKWPIERAEMRSGVIPVKGSFYGTFQKPGF